MFLILVLFDELIHVMHRFFDELMLIFDSKYRNMCEDVKVECPSTSWRTISQGYFQHVFNRDVHSGAAAADFLKIHRGSIFFEDIEKVYEFDKILVFTIETKGESTESWNPVESCGILWNPMESTGIHGIGRNPREFYRILRFSV